MIAKNRMIPAFDGDHHEKIAPMAARFSSHIVATMRVCVHGHLGDPVEDFCPDPGLL